MEAAGGSGGRGDSKTKTAGGGGGYPGAGIGGGGAGGAGGTCCAGAGGYTGGSGDSHEIKAVNGLAGEHGVHCNGELLGGGGYLQGAKGVSSNGINRVVKAYGGFGNQGHWNNLSDKSGSGGSGGAGGKIKVSETANVYAYNGNRFTDGTSYLDGQNQCPIYLQAGIKIASYEYKSENKPLFNYFTLIEKNPTGSVAMSGYVNKKVNSIISISGNTYFQNVDMSKQGVGSGAGFKETSNGTYKVTEELNVIPEDKL